jgi:hypothetical protein
MLEEGTVFVGIETMKKHCTSTDLTIIRPVFDHHPTGIRPSSDRYSTII